MPFSRFLHPSCRRQAISLYKRCQNNDQTTRNNHPIVVVVRENHQSTVIVALSSSSWREDRRITMNHSKSTGVVFASEGGKL